jgi:predicted nucleic acid-binding protein
MDVYVETNFVLELARLQEQQESCQELLELTETGRIKLILPAFSLAEPYETLIRSEKTRRNLSNELSRELSQLKRSLPYQQQVGTFQEITDFLVNSTQEEMTRFQGIVENLLTVSEVIPLTAKILTAALQYQSRLKLTPQDAIVYASVMEHLRESSQKPSCFLNKNSKDFDNPDIKEALNSYGCRILFKFDDGVSYVKSQIGIV